MADKTRKLKKWVILVIVPSLGVVSLMSLSVAPGTIYEVGTESSPLLSDPAAVPSSVAADAIKLATEVFGNYAKKYNDFVNQLLAAYSKARDNDFVMVFNSGGWGWTPVEASLGSDSIFFGIQLELNNAGYASLLLNYQRTYNNFLGRLGEVVSTVTPQPRKAEFLAHMVEFLTNHTSNVRIILVGESNGTIICDRAMNILKDNPKVYSIAIGPPFWHKGIKTERTLVLTDNGIIPDSFSRGDFWALLWGNLRYYLHLSQVETSFGTPPHYVGAPGHDYWWHYPEVRAKIINFLNRILEPESLSPCLTEVKRVG